MSLKNIKTKEQLYKEIRKKLNESLIPKLAKLTKQCAWQESCVEVAIRSTNEVVHFGYTIFYIFKENDWSKPIHISNFYKLKIPDLAILQFSRDVLYEIKRLEREKQEYEEILDCPNETSRTLLTEKFILNPEYSDVVDL